MRKISILAAVVTVLSVAAVACLQAEDTVTNANPATAGALSVQVVVDHNPSDAAGGDFKFKHIPAIAKDDAATAAKVTIIAGEADDTGGDVKKLTDGKVPSEEDQPEENFFFAAQTSGGKLLFDLGSAIDIKQINTYSWHPGSRGPQVYEVYGSDGSAVNFAAKPASGTELTAQGWTLIAKVDTRTQYGSDGGQYGVSVGTPNGTLGKYRYLIFDCHCTDEKDPFSNTFYSEIDVIDASGSPTTAAPASTGSESSDALAKTFDTADGKYHIKIDVSGAPDLADWAFQTLAPVMQEWYPKLIDALPSDGFNAPETVTVHFKARMNPGIPAYTARSTITLNTAWFRKNLKGEAVGAVVHEMVHVVQQYPGFLGRAGAPVPGWVTEGIPDYLRFFKYQPQDHGADDIWLQHHRIAKLHYDQSYRISANFLNWVSEKYDTNIVQKLNAAARQGNYSDDIWKNSTQKTVEELGDEWLTAKKGLLPPPPSQATNSPAASLPKS